MIFDKSGNQSDSYLASDLLPFSLALCVLVTASCTPSSDLDGGEQKTVHINRSVDHLTGDTSETVVAFPRDSALLLLWTCEELNKLQVGLGVHNPSLRSRLAGASPQVRYRFSNRSSAADKETWVSRAQGRALKPLHPITDSFTQTAVEADSVLIRVIDSSGTEAVTRSFSLRGLSDSLAALECMVGSPY